MPIDQEDKHIVYFGPGPTRLPSAIKDQLQSTLYSYQDTDLSILELSHRSPQYEQINQSALSGLYKLTGASVERQAFLLMGGGASLQFAAWTYNVIHRHGWQSETAHFIISGHWSERAADEAELLGVKVKRVKVVERGEEKVSVRLPPIDTLGRIVYYCQNETIDGIELPEIDFGPDRLVICDASSNFLSRPINPDRYTVLFAGAQKNVGVAGVTVVMVDRRMLDPPGKLPTMMDYAKMDRSKSVYNTPPVYAIYITHLMIEWLLNEFESLHAVDEFSQRKASILYSLADSSDSMYAPVPDLYRSRMNVVLRMREKGDKSVETIEKEIIEKACQHGFQGIKGHRDAGGGLRVSIYNSITVEDVEAFARFLKKHL